MFIMQTVTGVHLYSDVPDSWLCWVEFVTCDLIFDAATRVIVEAYADKAVTYIKQ